jgi:hypothetical protein
VNLDGQWLRSLGEDRLAMVLTRRPEVLQPPPTSLSMLATRLQHVGAVSAAMRRMNKPTIQVAEALAALGGTVHRDDLSRLLGGPDPAVLQAALDVLAEHALLLTGDDGELRLVPAARMVWLAPLGLGPSVDRELERLDGAGLRARCTALGLPTGRNAEMQLTLRRALHDADLVRSIVDSAPAEFSLMLAQMADTGAHVQDPNYWRHDIVTPVRWAERHCMVFPVGDWAGEFRMPAEVGLALRGSDYRAPFDPEPPDCPRAGDDNAGAQAAAASMLRLATNILTEASAGKVAKLSNGGVGIRELKRLAKTNGTSVDEVRLALALAHGAGLVAMMFETAVMPTDRYDDWLALEPAQRYAALVRAWWHLPYSPLETQDAAWVPRSEHDGTNTVREVVLRLQADPGGVISDPAGLVGLVAWHRPYALRRDLHGFIDCVSACLAEATHLGLVTSDAGRALLASDDDALVGALTGVGDVVRSAHLQADLSAVVPGTPSPRVSEVLDGLADREAGSAASMWRFSPASIRRALDAGRTPDDLLADLASIATSVPQTLEYLIKDVGRQHGAVRVSAAVACLRSDDETLLTLMVADKRLKSLRLRLLAPTVMASSIGLPETMAALRKAGYFPVEERADGSTVIAEAPRRRAEYAQLDAQWNTVDHDHRDAATATGPDPAAQATAKRLLSRTDEPTAPRQTPAPRHDPDLMYHLDAPPPPPPEERSYQPRWPRYR